MGRIEMFEDIASGVGGTVLNGNMKVTKYRFSVVELGMRTSGGIVSLFFEVYYAFFE